MMDEQNLPTEGAPWDAPDVFPEPPPDAGSYGYMSPGGRMKTCSRQRLERIFSPNVTLSNACLVWSPEAPRLVPPGEATFLHRELKKSARENVKVQLFQGIMFSILWTLELLTRDRGAPLFIALLVLTGILPVVTALRLWRAQRAQESDPIPADVQEDIELRRGRYQAWLAMQPRCFTRGLVLAVVVIGLTQVLTGLHQSIGVAGLQKPAAFTGEPWRLLTGPLLHGGLLHLMFNAYALLGLGSMVEALAGRAYAAVTFLVAALTGSLLSVVFMPSQPSVGASGGILGLAGFLAILGLRRRGVIPVPLFKALIWFVVLIGLAGLVAYQYIDNAAHLGGALAGVAFGALVIPKRQEIPLPRHPWLKASSAMSQLVLSAGVVLSLFLLISA
jgi:membrane associated rhomboid family serine protease